MKILFILLFILSCTEQQIITENFVETKSLELPTKYVAAWDSVKNQTWTDTTLVALEKFGKDLILITPKDISSFTKSKFDTPEKRKQFYVSLISCMSKYESSFDTLSYYTEKFPDNTGARVVSRGLLQISGESAIGYSCEVPKNNYMILHDPKINLECGVRILNRWIKKDLVLSSYVGERWIGGARYWAVLRNPVLSKVQRCISNLEKI